MAPRPVDLLLIEDQPSDAELALYERADRPVPPYLHDEPAEQRYNPGRREPQRIAADNQFTMERRQNDLYLTFGEDIRPWKIAEFRRHLPADVGADQEGRRIVVRSPERFEDWLGEIERDGLLSQIRSFLSP